MQLNFEAIVLSINKYGENSGIVSVLTEEYGIYRGLVRGITGVKQRGIYQQGNFVEAVWRGRLSEHLGSISAGLIYSGSSALMDNPLKLAALSSICAMLSTTLQERDAVPQIYNKLKSFINQINLNEEKWQESYVLLELELLAQLGFGLDLSSCAATGKVEELIYVSPKSGRAVSKEAGFAYKDKLLKLPDFMIQNQEQYKLSSEQQNNSNFEISDGISLCSYFLDKYFFIPNNISYPHARTRFVLLLNKMHKLESATCH